MVILILLAWPVFSSTPAQSEIDAVFKDYDSTVSPGCSMAVFRNGDIDYARGYGMANLEYGIANAPDTVFRIGSTSKQFTAMAMALLAEQGKISLDDDIHKFFPSMPYYGEPVTVRQLVHHTSGIRD